MRLCWLSVWTKAVKWDNLHFKMSQTEIYNHQWHKSRYLNNVKTMCCHSN